MPFSRIIGLTLRLLLVILISTPFMLALLALQTERGIEVGETLTSTELDEVERLLLESAPASTARPSQQRVLLGESELNLLLRYGLQVMNLTPDWSADAELSVGAVLVRASIALGGPEGPFFINGEGRLVSTGTNFSLDTLSIGNLSLPPSVTAFVSQRLQANLFAADVGFQDFADLLANIESANVQTQQLSLVVNWEPELIDRLANRARQLFLPESDRLRIAAYYDEIRRIVATIPTDLRAVSLNTFLIPLFNHAADQSLVSGEPIAENRSALQALAVYVNNEDIAQLLGTEIAANLEPAPFIEVRLQRRQDLAQHLVSIAAISASAGAGVAELLSTTKEAYDARYRSGFSFSDLTANSVGVTLASFATRDRDTALLMQQRLSATSSESDYMPEVGNNRDGLSESDFVSQYRDRNSPEYQQRLNDIQALIDARPLFRALN